MTSDPTITSESSDFPLLDASFDFDPAAQVEDWRLTLPAKPACFVLEDGAGRPILLSTMTNLRAALVHRLGAPAADEPTRKVDYRAITRRVRYRPVFSRFEGQWVYLENVRTMYPRTYRKLIRRWRAMWIAIDPTEAHPRFVSVDRPLGKPAMCFGPFATTAAARRYVQMLEDLFDLCREYPLLVQEPHATACAYKQMGKCPAPCDGSVTMAAYREQLAAAVRFVTGPRADWRSEAEQAMRAAAGERRYEAAQKHKARLELASFADSAACAKLRPLEAFRFVSLQPGSRKGRVNMFTLTPQHITPLGEITPKNRDERLAAVLEAARTLSFDAIDVDRASFAAWSIANPHRTGRFLPVETLTEATLADAVDACSEQGASDRNITSIDTDTDTDAN
ncbi:MAG: hypothetical protein GC162_10105 [Planctomycetes bacterium]|nr:hypothetical protein [Planctomycetota bacterium]